MMKLFSPITMGKLELNNRIAMAPMTRARVNNPFDAADDDTATYFAQRASAGLLITEGSQISKQGQGFLFIPGIYSEEQVQGWQKTTQAVHAKGGKIFIQIWHVGRMSHTSLQPNNQAPVSSVAVKAKGTCFAYDEQDNPGKVDVSEPTALTPEGIEAIKQDYVNAAKNAIRAGFDGVEIHGANGYLLEQFINAGLNTRDDQYGGQTIENRLRLTLEVVDDIAAAIGSDKTAIRIAPFGRFSDMPAFEGEEETWLALGDELNKRNLAYVHLSEQGTIGDAFTIPKGFTTKFRQHYKGIIMIAGGFTKETAEEYIQSGDVDMVAFGRPYIGNPDLVERMQNNWPLVEADRAIFYGGDSHGYIDFPAYQVESA
ncbi:alkene reductase [Vibrio sp. CAIM 722]|uniref:Alkene reductase n=1 Tax=Vibrio eleionomae TaxID=2653505 RepID=A0A7X4LJZ7_9VIBR|nr:alkene reductase [Vibrio eleionomae]MZI93332.1 alkene reductase [Vibrio eleionomae]